MGSNFSTVSLLRSALTFPSTFFSSSVGDFLVHLAVETSGGEAASRLTKRGNSDVGYQTDGAVSGTINRPSSSGTSV